MNNHELENRQAEYESKLAQYGPVELVYQAELAQVIIGRDLYDTAFHHFMYDYVGSIADSRQSPVIKKEYDGIGVLDYSNRMYAGFTDSGKMLLVRCSSDAGIDCPEQFFIATADVTTGQIAEWNVTELMSRDKSGFECYMESQDGDEARLALGMQKIQLTTAGARRPEGVAVLDKAFFDLLEVRRRLYDAPQVGKLVVAIAAPDNLNYEQDPVTIAA